MHVVSNSEGYDDSIKYLTKKTKNMVDNGELTVSAINTAVRNIEVDELLQHEEEFKNCWNERLEVFNNLYSSRKTYVGKSNDGLYDTLALLEMQKCLTYDMVHMNSGNVDTYIDGWHVGVTSNEDKKGAMAIEIGAGGAIGFYIQGATGFVWSERDPNIKYWTYSTCKGIKGDASFGFSLTLSYFYDEADVLGSGRVFEVGLDIPFTEAGVDVLFYQTEDGKRATGVGISFGIGIGLLWVDVAVSHCTTKKIADFSYHQFSKVLNVGQYSGWDCDYSVLGAISEDKYICCVGQNTAKGCTSELCWFDGVVCPTEPRNTDKYGLAYYPGAKWIADGYNNEEKCLSLWRLDNTMKYVVYDFRYNECWHISDQAKCEGIFVPQPTNTEPYMHFYNRAYPWPEYSCD